MNKTILNILISKFLKKIVDQLPKIITIRSKKELVSDLQKLNNHFETIFDVGAHEGEYTDLFKENFRIKNAFIFEPIPKIYNFLKDKYKRHKKFLIFNNLIGEKNSIEYFNISPHFRSSSKKNVNKNSFYFKVKKVFLGEFYVNKIKVKQIKLDNFLSKVKTIDLLKIDVEGNELEVLKGCKILLKKKIIKVIYLEILNHNLYKDYSKKEIHSFLIANNFKLFRKYKTRILFAEDRLYVLNDLLK